MRVIWFIGLLVLVCVVAAEAKDKTGPVGRLHAGQQVKPVHHNKPTQEEPPQQQQQQHQQQQEGEEEQQQHTEEHGPIGRNHGHRNPNGGQRPGQNHGQRNPNAERRPGQHHGQRNPNAGGQSGQRPGQNHGQRNPNAGQHGQHGQNGQHHGQDGQTGQHHGQNGQHHGQHGQHGQHNHGHGNAFTPKFSWKSRGIGPRNEKEREALLVFDESTRIESETPFPGADEFKEMGSNPAPGIVYGYIGGELTSGNYGTCSMPGQCWVSGNYLACNNYQPINYTFFDPLYQYSDYYVYKVSLNFFGNLGCSSTYNEVYMNNYWFYDIYGYYYHCPTGNNCFYYCDTTGNINNTYFNYYYDEINRISIPTGYNTTYLCTSKVQVGIFYYYYPQCPNNCSGNGICLGNGTCVCKNGYSGSDCSKHEAKKCCLYYQPSSNIANGWCQLSSPSCPSMYDWRLISHIDVPSCQECRPDNPAIPYTTGEDEPTDQIGFRPSLLQHVVFLVHRHPLIAIGVTALLLALLLSGLIRLYRKARLTGAPASYQPVKATL